VLLDRPPLSVATPPIFTATPPYTLCRYDGWIEFSMTLKATHEGKGKLFLDAWKKRSSIVIFLNCVSRMKHRKLAASQEQRFLMGFWFLGLTAIYLRVDHRWQNHPRCQASRQKTIKNSEGLPFHAFSLIKPGCNQGTCNKDPYLSIYAKRIFL
jgi:hypothetical protein